MASKIGAKWTGDKKTTSDRLQSDSAYQSESAGDRLGCLAGPVDGGVETLDSFGGFEVTPVVEHGLGDAG